MFEFPKGLEFFLAVDDADRFVAVAECLLIGQPTLTQAIAGLGERFGAPLREPKYAILHATLGKHVWAGTNCLNPCSLTGMR